MMAYTIVTLVWMSPIIYLLIKAKNLISMSKIIKNSKVEDEKIIDKISILENEIKELKNKNSS